MSNVRVLETDFAGNLELLSAPARRRENSSATRPSTCSLSAAKTFWKEGRCWHFSSQSGFGERVKCCGVRWKAQPPPHTGDEDRTSISTLNLAAANGPRLLERAGHFGAALQPEAARKRERMWPRVRNDEMPFSCRAGFMKPR